MKARLRKIVFWLHLGLGLLAGIIIFTLCLSGLCISFDNEIADWADTNRRVSAGKNAALPLDTLLQKARENADAAPSAITISNDSADAYTVSFGRGKTVYINPYTGEVREQGAQSIREFMQFMTRLHRWLTLSGENRAIGSTIKDAATFVFLFLSLSGLWLWWPRNWSWRGIKNTAWFISRAKGKTRDWNWHNVFGFWSLPIIILLCLTGIIMAYPWANRLLYASVGETPPARGPRGETGPPRQLIPPPDPDAKGLDHQALLLAAQKAFPDHERISFRLAILNSEQGRPDPRADANTGPGNRPENGEPARPRRENPDPTTAANRQRPPRAERPSAAEENDSVANRRERRGERRSNIPHPSADGLAPVNITVRQSSGLPLVRNHQVSLNPYTGEVLETKTFADNSLGQQLRIWVRYLHTGEALGWPGQFVAALACFAGLMLVWTGFALTWRRFFKRKKPAQA